MGSRRFGQGRFLLWYDGKKQAGYTGAAPDLGCHEKDDAPPHVKWRCPIMVARRVTSRFGGGWRLTGTEAKLWSAKPPQRRATGAPLRFAPATLSLRKR